MRYSRRFFVSIAALALLPGGCIVSVEPNGNDNSSGTDSTIHVRVINATNVTLDPEIYAAATPVDAVGLFLDGNKYISFGVGTLGLLGPNASDSFDIESANARVIGTKGGKFGDDLSQPDGVGQQVILTQDLSVYCGGTLTLTYSRAGGGFATSFTVTR